MSDGLQADLTDDQAFQSFINTNPRAPEFLSLYIDEHLKKGTKAVSYHLVVLYRADKIEIRRRNRASAGKDNHPIPIPTR
jgi:hypothetical protein